MSRPAQPVNVNLALGNADGDQLLENLMHFARLLRRIGFKTDAETGALAAQALARCGFSSRRDTYWALAAVFVQDAAQLPVFAQAFALFWRSERARAEAQAGEQLAAAGEQTLRRLAEQLGTARRQVRVRLQADASGTASDSENLRDKDFEQMSDSEWRAAMRCIRQLPAAMPPLITRRRRAANDGRCDLRRTLRAARTSGGEAIQIKNSAPQTQPPAIVILADISASMSAYARMLVHFIAALSSAPQQPVHAFLFGTRLTPLRRLKSRDADAAVATIARATQDWQGGTRIGESLAEFNRLWSRRVLAGGAVVLLATDGLERGDLSLLEMQVQRLRKSCRRLLWLNPLLRYEAYQPLAGGARLLQRGATQMHSIHNVETLAGLMDLLSGAGQSRI